MKVGLILPAAAPERYLHAAARLRQALEAERRAGADLEVGVLSPDPDLAGRELPGGGVVQHVRETRTGDPGASRAAGAPRHFSEYLALQGEAALSCDVWVLIEAATDLPLSLTRPTVLWSPRFPDRLGAAALPSRFPDWAPGLAAAVCNRLSACRVVVHDDIGQADALHYAQIPPDRVMRLPLPPPLRAEASIGTGPMPSDLPYILWHLPGGGTGVLRPGSAGGGVAPLSPLPVLQMLERYWGPRFGQCRVILHDAAPTPAEARWRTGIELAQGDSGTAGPIRQAGAPGGEDLARWAAYADALILGPDWLQALPALEVARRRSVPVLLTGPEALCGLPTADLPRAFFLPPESGTGTLDQAAALLKRGETEARRRATPPVSQTGVTRTPEEDGWPWSDLLHSLHGSAADPAPPFAVASS